MTFVIGGARSGKSTFAEDIARKYNNVVYIATAEARDDEMRERIKFHRARRPSDWETVEAPFHVDRVISSLNEKVNLIYIDCVTLYITNMLLSDETGACRGERPFAPAKNDENSPPLTPPARGGETKGVATPGEGETKGEATSPSLEGRGRGEGEGEILKQKQSQILEEINNLCKVCRESKSDVIIVSNEVGLGIVPDNALSRVFRDIAGSANQIIADEADEVYFMVAGIAQRIK